MRQSFFKPNDKAEYDQEVCWKSYLAHFKGPHSNRFAVASKKDYDKRSKAPSLHFKKWKTGSRQRRRVNITVDHFSQRNRESLPELEKKKQHQRVNCQACDVHHYAFQALLPSWGKKSSNGLQNVVNRTQKRVLQPSNPSNVRPTLKAIKRTVSIIYNEIDGPFKELFSMSFAKAQTKTSELNLQEKKYQAQLKKERREKLRSKLRNNGQNGIVTPCWALGRHTVSDRNSVWLWSLRPQMK